MIELVKHETCSQYVARRLSEGWKIVWQCGHYLILSSPEGDILRPVDLRNDVETLVPNAPGAECNIGDQTACSACNNHFDCIDALDDLKFVKDFNTPYTRDLYNLPNSGVGAGVINHITVFARAKAGDPRECMKICVKSGVTVAESAKTVTTLWVTYSAQWTQNPDDLPNPWTWANINALQIGVALLEDASGGYTYCSQVYVEVDYNPPVWTGKISGVTNPAKVMGVDVANIEKVKGIA